MSDPEYIQLVPSARGLKQAIAAALAERSHPTGGHRMKVIIAHPVAAEAHDTPLDGEVDLDDAVARVLLNDGHARLPEAVDPDSLPSKVSDLRSLADGLGIDAKGMKKADLIAAISEARSAQPTTAPTGDDTEGA